MIKYRRDFSFEHIALTLTLLKEIRAKLTRYYLAHSTKVYDFFNKYLLIDVLISISLSFNNEIVSCRSVINFTGDMIEEISYLLMKEKTLDLYDWNSKHIIMKRRAN